VRTVGADGTPNQTPAAVSFVILPPLWQRWWFLGLWLLALAGAAYAFYRYRLRRVLELERVRMRIATELHDDIGTSLSRIALLSEVVKQQTGALNLRTAQLLNDISDSARELLDSMSDIVWSIDPRRDDVEHVVARIRQFASDVLGARHIAWELQVAPEVEQLKLQPEPRRQLYLIYKEAINNIAKHARCRAVTLELSAADRQLKAVIHDDGCGFDVRALETLPSEGYGGHGLGSMRARVQQLGGQFHLESAPGHGTRLTFQIPLNKVTA
jgi:signal transduction histidine kinase